MTIEKKNCKKNTNLKSGKSSAGRPLSRRTVTLSKDVGSCECKQLPTKTAEGRYMRGSRPPTLDVLRLVQTTIR